MNAPPVSSFSVHSPVSQSARHPATTAPDAPISQIKKIVTNQKMAGAPSFMNSQPIRQPEPIHAKQ